MVGLDWVGPNMFVDGKMFLSVVMGEERLYRKYCYGALRFKYVQERQIAPIFGQTTAGPAAAWSVAPNRLTADTKASR